MSVTLLPAVMLLEFTLTTKCVAAVGMTTMAWLAPARLLVCVSMAVRVWLPKVCKVALKTPTPPVKVLAGGNVAALSLLVKPTVPE